MVAYARAYANILARRSRATKLFHYSLFTFTLLPQAVPATQMASDAGIPTLANMIIAGKLLKILNADAPDSVAAALEKVISAKHRDMLDVNRKALEMGAEAK